MSPKAPDELISPAYRELNRQLHAERLDYGAGGHAAQHADAIRGIMTAYGLRSLLDYDCGKQVILELLRLPFAKGYDPCIAGLDVPPQPADIVICLDVMEHIEPDKVEAVLDHIQSLTKTIFYCTVSLVPAKKTLPDGRNTHICLRPAAWWLQHLLARWELDTYRGVDTEFTAVMRVRGTSAKNPMQTMVRG